MSELSNHIVMKLKKCRICKVKHTPTRNANVCASHDCQLAYALLSIEKRNRLELAKTKRDHKAKLVAMKSIPNLIKEAQTAFNAFIRARDKNELCICCDKPYGTNELGGKYDCGHFRSRGSAGHLRFNEDNAFGQRKYCNTYGALNFREGVIVRIGLARVEAIENNNITHKWERSELIDIKKLYKDKLKKLNEKVV